MTIHTAHAQKHFSPETKSKVLPNFFSPRPGYHSVVAISFGVSIIIVYLSLHGVECNMVRHCIVGCISLA